MKKIGEKFLPIGTVVMLKDGTKRVMITSFCVMAQGDEKKMWDYGGCLYPEGFLQSDQTCLFDHEQIQEIYHMGLAEDEEEKEFKANLKKAVEELESQSSEAPKAASKPKTTTKSKTTKPKA